MAFNVGDLVAVGPHVEGNVYIIREVEGCNVKIVGLNTAFHEETFRPATAKEMNHYLSVVICLYEQLDDATIATVKGIFSDVEFERLYLSA